MKTLFDHAREKLLREEAPLAARMRPRTLQEYIGQEHILAPGRLLRRAIQADQISSLIFYGPPGTGKTTLASVIANTTKSHFVTLNAVMAGIADLREITTSAQARLGEIQVRTILFIDEVHRWNKAQQDALLPWVENGTIILIGATTENPYFTVNRALVSRSRIFQLKPLDDNNIKDIVRQAIADPVRGYGGKKIQLDDDALGHLANVANGDARAALNALELAVETTEPNQDGIIHIDMAVAEESIQKRAVLYDREGDYHFDTISAFIKSMRGSDPDATFYWLAKMIYAGEDPRFIFRRMTIFASEDIGMADPQALSFVISAAEAFDRVGLPEGHYPLAHAALYCATAPKSNSVMGFFDALKLVGAEREEDVPNHLKDASRDQKGFGHGIGYQYPHAYRDHWVAQQYLPASLQGKLFYEPGTIGYEAKLADTVRQRRELQLAAIREADDQLAPPEILTFSPTDKTSERWLARAADNLAPQLATIRERLFKARNLNRHDLVIDLTADNGACLWHALRSVPEGGAWGRVNSLQNKEILLEQAQNLAELTRPNIVVAPRNQLKTELQNSQWKDVRFDFAVGRNWLSTEPSRDMIAKELFDLLVPGATLAIAENITRHSQRITDLLAEFQLPWLDKAREAEEKIYVNPDDPLVNWDESTLEASLANAGFNTVKPELVPFHRETTITLALLNRWFDNTPQSFKSRLLNHLDEAAVNLLFKVLQENLVNRKVIWGSQVAFLTATKP